MGRPVALTREKGHTVLRLQQQQQQQQHTAASVRTGALVTLAAVIGTLLFISDGHLSGQRRLESALRLRPKRECPQQLQLTDTEHLEQPLFRLAVLNTETANGVSLKSILMRKFKLASRDERSDNYESSDKKSDAYCDVYLPDGVGGHHTGEGIDTVYISMFEEPVKYVVRRLLSNLYNSNISIVNLTSSEIVHQLVKYLDENDPDTIVNTPNVYTQHSWTYDICVNVTANDYIVDQATQHSDPISIVILDDYFDESLILLRRYMKWNMKDIMYVPTLSKKLTINPNITGAISQAAQDKLTADFRSYDFFHENFWLNTRCEAAGFHSEVLRFKEVKDVVTSYCLYGHLTKPLIVHRSQWNKEFRMSKEECARMKEAAHGIH